METSRISALAAGLALGLAGLTMAQDRESAPPSSQAPGLFARSVGLHYLDGQLWAAGRDFKVLFEEDRFTYTPALGSRAPRNYPLTMRVESFGRGATRQAVGPAALSAEDLTARYQRADFTETYEIRPEGIKQSFVFDHLPPGTGDLVVRTRIDTDLQPARTGLIEGNLLFSVADLGGVDIGAVVGIDGKGARVQGTMRYEDGVLEMRLPAAFVEQATLPVVLDPLVASQIAVRAHADDNLEPDLAYNTWGIGGYGDYLVVFVRRVSATDRDIHGQRVDHGGTLNGNLLIFQSGPQDEHDPAVAFVRGVISAFVVVYSRNDNDVHARPLGISPNSVPGNEIIVVAHIDREVFPQVGGEIGSGDDAICVWENSTSNKIQGREIRVSGPSSGSPTLSTPGLMVDLVTGGSTRVSRPRIPQSGGPDGRYLVVYERFFPGHGDPQGLVIDRDLNILDPLIAMSGHAADEERLAVAGDGTNWVVAWQTEATQNSGDNNIAARSVYYDVAARAALPISSVVTIAGHAGVDEIRPCVAAVSDGSYLVGWQSRVGTLLDWNVYVRSVDLFTCLDCEGQFTVSDARTTDVGLQIASEHSGGGSLENALLVWQESGTTFNGDIKARFWRTHDGSGARGSVGCGNGSTGWATCARVGNLNFTFRVRGAAPSAAAWLILSPDRSYLPPGGCGLVPNPWSGFVFPAMTDSSGNGELTIPIPNAPSLSGMALFGQWFVPGPGGTLSGAQQVQVH